MFCFTNLQKYFEPLAFSVKKRLETFWKLKFQQDERDGFYERLVEF